jgi:hypothetical protein
MYVLPPQVETTSVFEYKFIAEKHVTNKFYSPGAYVTSLAWVHLPFTFVILAFFYTYVVLGADTATATPTMHNVVSSLSHATERTTIGRTQSNTFTLISRIFIPL